MVGTRYSHSRFCGLVWGSSDPLSTGDEDRLLCVVRSEHTCRCRARPPTHQHQVKLREGAHPSEITNQPRTTERYEEHRNTSD